MSETTYMITDDLNNGEIVNACASVEEYKYTKKDLSNFINNEMRKHEKINNEQINHSRDTNENTELSILKKYLKEFGYSLLF